MTKDICILYDNMWISIIYIASMLILKAIQEMKCKSERGLEE